jgi:osmotically-inducible protein OsmY
MNSISFFFRNAEESDMRDLELHRRVLAELEYDPSVDAANIGVMVNDGVVTLTGHVPNYAEKVAAERAVRRVKGVRAIAEEIEIRLPHDKKTADDEIAKRAADILRWDSQVPKDAIQITVQDGWVTLSGAVEWQYQRSAAVGDIYKLSGVAGVNNHIKIRSPVQAADIQNRIEEALKRNAEIEAEGINVTVRDGAVTLTGFVHDLAEHDAIRNAAWSAPGVQSVDDQLRFSD